MRDLKIAYAKGTAEDVTHGKRLEMEIFVIIKKDW